MVGQLIQRGLNLGQRGTGIVCHQQGPRCLVLHTVPQQLQIRTQPDGNAAIMDHLAVFLAQKSPAAGGKYAGRAVQKAGNHLGFAVAKEGLAIAGEDFGNAHIRGNLDLGIRIKKRHAKKQSSCSTVDTSRGGGTTEVAGPTRADTRRAAPGVIGRKRK